MLIIDNEWNDNSNTQSLLSQAEPFQIINHKNSQGAQQQTDTNNPSQHYITWYGQQIKDIVTNFIITS